MGGRFSDLLTAVYYLYSEGYALDAMEARELKEVWRDPHSWMEAEGTSFEKELELLLFDM